MFSESQPHMTQPLRQLYKYGNFLCGRVFNLFSFPIFCMQFSKSAAKCNSTLKCLIKKNQKRAGNIFHEKFGKQ